MKKLEDYINQNRAQFDDNMPGKLHEAKFINLLNNNYITIQANRFSTINNWLKVAAVAIALIGLGVGIIAIVGNPENKPLNSEGKLPPELIEIEQYYTTLTNKKIDQIEKLAGSDSEARKVKASLNEEIKNLRANSESLKEEYIKGNNNERLVDAIRNNYRILSSLLNKVIEELSKQETKASEIKKLSNSNDQKYEITYA